MPDQKFEQKWKELQQYVPFLQRIINNLKRTMKDRPRPIQLEKMEMLYDLLTKRDKNKLKYETLIKCETLLNKIYNKVEKPPPKPITMSSEIVEILEPDSPTPEENDRTESFRPPIEIPIERVIESPNVEKRQQQQQQQSISTLTPVGPAKDAASGVVISNELSLDELYKQRELLENKIFKCNQKSSNSNSSNDISLTNNESTSLGEIEQRSKSSTGASKTELLMDMEVTRNSPILEATASSVAKMKRSGAEKPQKDRHGQWKVGGIGPARQKDFGETGETTVQQIRNKKIEKWSQHAGNKSFDSDFQRQRPFNTVSDIDIQTTKNTILSRSSTPDWDDEMEQEEEKKKLKLQKENDSRNKMLEHRKGIDSPSFFEASKEASTANRESSSERNSWDQPRDANQSFRRDKNQNRHNSGWDQASEKNIFDSNRLSPPPALTHVAKFLDDIESSESRSMSPIDSSDSNKSSGRFNAKNPNIQKKPITDENKLKITVAAPSIYDVLKSPPLSANDIDDLLLESSTKKTETKEDSIEKSNLHEVRKKLAKISTKMHNSKTSTSETGTNSDYSNERSKADIEKPNPASKSSDLGSNDRLALKYNPHMKKNYAERNIFFNNKPAPNAAATHSHSNTGSGNANTFPTVNLNDPRLRNKCNAPEPMKVIKPAPTNYVTNPIGKPIPSLLSQIIPPPVEMIQSNLKINFPKNLIDIPLQPHLPLMNSNPVGFNQPPMGNIIPTVTIPKATFTDFLNNQSQMMQQNAVNSPQPSGYNKINPIQNDNFERQKYLESKRPKMATVDSFGVPFYKLNNPQPKTYGEYRRQCEIERNTKGSKRTELPSKPVSASAEASVASADKNKVETAASSETIADDQHQTTASQTKDNKLTGAKESTTAACPKSAKPIAKRRDSFIQKIEVSEKHSKTTAHHLDAPHTNKVFNLAEIGSISKFKIPKKQKDESEEEAKYEEKSKVAKGADQEQKPVEASVRTETESNNSDSEKLNVIPKSERSNVGEAEQNSKEQDTDAEEEIKIVTRRKRRFRNPKTEKSASNSIIAKRRRSIAASPALLADTILEIAAVDGESRTASPVEGANPGKLVIRRKSMSATAAAGSSSTFECKREASQPPETSDEKIQTAETSSTKEDTESLLSVDTTDSQSVSSQQGVVPKRRRRQKRAINYFYELAPLPIDNSILSLENIIQGKRRSRSSINMNESALAPPKYVSKQKISANSSQSSTQPIDDLNQELSVNDEKLVSVKSESDHKVFDREQAAVKESDTMESEHNDESNSHSDISTACINQESRSSTASDNKMGLNSEIFETLLANIGDPNIKKVNLLGVLSKICDEKKFEKIKAILEEEDDRVEQEKAKNCISTGENVSCSKAKNDESDDKKESTTPKAVEKGKRLRHKTELDRLNEDIRDMFISQGVLSANGKRIVAQVNAAASIKPEQSSPKHQPGKTSTSKRMNKASGSAKPSAMSTKLKKLKIILKKIDLSTVLLGSSTDAEDKRNSNIKLETMRAKTTGKRKRGCAWARGNISKKRTGGGTSNQQKKPTVKKLNPLSAFVSPEEDLKVSEAFEPMEQQSPVPINNDKPSQGQKPCPRSRKKFFAADADELAVVKVISNQNDALQSPGDNFILPQNLKTLKNTDKRMHVRSKYAERCLLCDKYCLLPDYVLHYIEKHPEHEVLISRLPPDTLEDLRSDRNNTPLYQYGSDKVNKRGISIVLYHYRCPFCDIQQTSTRCSWVHHFATHTGEYQFHCSGCRKSSNFRSEVERHLKIVCKNGKLVKRQKFPPAKALIRGFVCNLCNYTQLIEMNLVRHMVTQHSSNQKENFIKIKLMNMDDVPMLERPPSAEPSSSAEPSPSARRCCGQKKAKINEVFDDFWNEPFDANKSQSEEMTVKKSGESSDVFMPKDQSDLSVDKSMLSYMDEVSFSSALDSPRPVTRASKSIVDELSERLGSTNSDSKSKSFAGFDEENISKSVRQKDIKNRSIVDVLSQRFQNISEHKSAAATSADTEPKEQRQQEAAAVDKETDYDKDETTPIVYILDQIDDDNLDNIELCESNEQVVVPINKPISNKRADILDKIGCPSANQLSFVEENEQIADSIYATLNEKLKKTKDTSDSKTESPVKAVKAKPIKSSGITIIDRLNKRLRETIGVTATGVRSSHMAKKKPKTKLNSTSGCDSGDDNLVIDEDFDAVSDTTSHVSESESAIAKTKSAAIEDASDIAADQSIIEDDDDCWEDIEILTTTPQGRRTSNSVEQSTDGSQNAEDGKKTPTDKQTKEHKTKTIRKTLSKLYVSLGKNKMKSKIKSTQENRSLAAAIVTDESCDSIAETQGSASKLGSRTPTPTQQQQGQTSQISDLITDSAIPSPIHTELTTNPPVPLPSEPLSDLNDISAILEPSPTGSDAVETAAAAGSKTTAVCSTSVSTSPPLPEAISDEAIMPDTLPATLNINDINETIYVLPDNVSVADAIAIATELKSSEIKKEATADQESPEKDPVTLPKPYRINNLGFRECNGQIKYLCLVDACSFMFSDQEIGLQNHYCSDHKAVTWDCYCYTCEAFISSEDELPLDRELKHMIEVHIKNILKSQSVQTESAVAASQSNSDSNKSFEEVLMANRPKITIRRLSGDLLSISKPPEPAKPTIKISLLPSTQLQVAESKANGSASDRMTSTSEVTSAFQTALVPEATSLSIKEMLNTPSIPPPVPIPATMMDESVSIRNLLETPSVPPPLPQPVNSKPKQFIVKTLQTPCPRLQVKTYARQNGTAKTGQGENCSPAAVVPVPVSTSPIPSIKNNIASGSGLKISSVCQAVKEITSSTSTGVTAAPQPTSASAIDQLKIVSVAGGIRNIQTQPDMSNIPPKLKLVPMAPIRFVGSPKQTSDISSVITITPVISPALSSNLTNNQVKPVVISPSSNLGSNFLRIENVCSLSTAASSAAVTMNPVTSQTTTNSTATSSDVSSIAVTATTESSAPCESTSELSNTNESSLIKIVKPWIYPTVSKPSDVAQYQLHAISLYADFKCMHRSCFFTTCSPTAITEHFENHEKELTASNNDSDYQDWLRCCYCTFTAKNTADYLAHFSTLHKNDIFQCPYCFYRSCNDFNVVKHIEEYHPDGKTKIFVCNGERKRLASEMKHLAIFRAKYIKPISCFDCKKKFFILRNYLKHLQDHNKESDCYTCGMCSATGLLKKNADYHLSLVHRVSVYQCIYCDMSSSLRNFMIKHMAKEHPSNLLYSCVRVSPHKNASVLEETIENSTVLANLNENVNVQYLQPCYFTTELLNGMSPSLEPEAIEENKKGRHTRIAIEPAVASSAIPAVAEHTSSPKSALKIASVTSLATKPQVLYAMPQKPIDIVAPMRMEIAAKRIDPDKTILSSSLDKVIESVMSEKLPKDQPNSSQTDNNETITIDDDSDVERDESKSKAGDKKSEGTKTLASITPSADINKTNDATKMAEILKNCTELTKSVALGQEQQEININISFDRKQQPNVSQQVPKQPQLPNTNGLHERIVEAAHEYVVDTGYEGANLYRCCLPECSNCKLDSDTISLHYSQKHPRLRQFKCPHCTCQYNNIRSLKGHLVTHKRHRYFCFLCIHTSSLQPQMSKHIADLHGKINGLISFPLVGLINSNMSKKSRNESTFFIIAPHGTKQQDFMQFGERLIRTCELKRSLAKRSFSPNEIDQLPLQAIFTTEVCCALCKYRTKVRTNMYRHLLFHKTEVKVASVDPVNPVPCLVSNEKNFDKMMNMAMSSNLNKDGSEKQSQQAADASEPTKADDAPDAIEETRPNATQMPPNPESKVSLYVPLMRRFVCNVSDCNYLTIADYMLKSHLQTLHSNVTQYMCPHCDVEIFSRITLSADKILNHMRYHDRDLFRCNQCGYIHYWKQVVERHVNHRHSDLIGPLEISHFVRSETETKVTKYVVKKPIEITSLTLPLDTPVTDSTAVEATIDLINDESFDGIAIADPQAELGGGESSPMSKMTPAEENNNKWMCTTCKVRTLSESDMLHHINTVHNIRFRYKCFHCKFGACQIQLVKEHISDRHPNIQQRQVKSNYCHLDESDNDVVQENRPLWSRSDPYRIKHIRGILMEEEVVGKRSSKSSGDNKKSSKKKPSTASASEASSATASKRKSLEKKLSENSIPDRQSISSGSNVVILNESSSSSMDSNSKLSAAKAQNTKDPLALSVLPSSTAISTSAESSRRSSLETSSGTVAATPEATVISTAPEHSVEIYECYYCPMKNISFKVVYTHWLLHHCRKTNDKVLNDNKSDKSGPLIAKPFAFKVVGYIGPDSMEVSTYDISSNQLVRLLKMGQRVTRFQCNKCWRLFANSVSVADHQKNEHSHSTTDAHRCLTFKNRNFFICSACGYASSLECKTAAHLLNHYEGLKKCLICMKDYDKFLDFIRHLPKHNVSFREFIEKDRKITELWSKIIVLFPNGLCMMRSNVPASCNIVFEDLLDIVSREVNTALEQFGAPKMKHLTPLNITPTLSAPALPLKSTTEHPQISEKIIVSPTITDLRAPDPLSTVQMPPDDKSKIAKLIGPDLDTRHCKYFPNLNFRPKQMAEDIDQKKSTDSVADGKVTMALSVCRVEEEKPALLPAKKSKLEPQTNKLLVKPKPKRTKSQVDSDWLPHAAKKARKSTDINLACDDDSDDSHFDDFFIRGSSSDDARNADDDDDDDDLPLSAVLRTTQSSLRPLIGPKSAQKRFRNNLTPYSYYGTKSPPENLNSLMVNITFKDPESGDGETLTFTCQQYAQMVPLDCYVLVEKLNPNILRSSSVNLMKRRKVHRSDSSHSTSTTHSNCSIASKLNADGNESANKKAKKN